MNKVIKLGMLFNESELPDFGSIQQKSTNLNILYLLAEDIPKLNSMLTRASSQSYMPEGESFDFHTGALAFVANHKTAGSGKIYAYHRGKDHWYEFNIHSDLELFDFMWNHHARILRETKTISGTPPLTFKSNGRPLKNYRIYGNTVNGESVGDLVTEGEHIGEYCVPVTITNGTDTTTANIYLQKQIRKVGDELEYIDFKKQKQYRIRKNLVNITSSNYEIRNYGITWTINEDNSVTANGSTQSPFALFLVKLYLKQGRYIINGCPENGGQNTYRCEIRDTGLSSISQDVGSGATVNIASDGFYYYSIRIASGYTCNDLIFYPMIRKSGIEDDTYEPYIKNNESDITLPALHTFSNSNTLSVNSTVQPLSIEVKGNITEII